MKTTKEEAKKRLQIYKPYLLGDEWKETYQIAINALEKQIPKKPIYHCNRNYYAVYLCPICKNFVRHGECCSNNDCRQAIDWSEELEKAEKYKWHNLKENPEDLPKEVGIYEVYRPFTSHKYSICFCGSDGSWYDNYMFDDTKRLDNNDIVAWKYIEPFEEVEDEKNR